MDQKTYLTKKGIETIAIQKCNYAGHTARCKDSRRLYIGKRKRGQPLSRRTWKKVAQNRKMWNNLRTSCVQTWTVEEGR